jgi:arginase
MERISLIGIPSEAGTHFPGQSRAFEALLNAGLGEHIADAGYRVDEPINLLDPDRYPEAAEASKWKPAVKVFGVRNLWPTVRVLRHIKSELVARQLVDLDGAFPVVVGGDCSITPAVLSAVHHSQPPGKRVGLMYVDGDADLTVLEEGASQVQVTGILDSMVMSHLTLREGCLPNMAEFGTREGEPLVTPDNVVLFGFDPLQPATDHWVYLLENGFKSYTRPTVQKQPVKSAQEALKWLEKRVDVIIVHFDVDVIDSSAFPLANYPHYAGLTHYSAFDALQVFIASPKVRGLVLTEINPNNDHDGSLIKTLIEEVTMAFKSRADKRSSAQEEAQ